MSDTTERAAQTMLAVRWPDGTISGMPGRKVIDMLAEALADAGLLATTERDAEQRRAGAVEALREVMRDMDAPIDRVRLRDRANRIEAQR